eukprot:TRINITY_DN8831_c0_g1_i1.p1 TRINITY_DN8831_c0_g1~~TRINITY_DN8831_c0_g1_i1.p1  ORF type:complete len:231 (+),score=49.84 TRINITY_DN8831_c0_g1_i1:182-874(+)
MQNIELLDQLRIDEDYDFCKCSEMTFTDAQLDAGPEFKPVSFQNFEVFHEFMALLGSWIDRLKWEVPKVDHHLLMIRIFSNVLSHDQDKFLHSLRRARNDSQTREEVCPLSKMILSQHFQAINNKIKYAFEDGSAVPNATIPQPLKESAKHNAALEDKYASLKDHSAIVEEKYAIIEEKYAIAKDDNATLTNRIRDLEEQILKLTHREKTQPKVDPDGIWMRNFERTKCF